jgi:MFS family permease
LRSWIVWGTGLLAYIVAVLNRTTFGVSGLAAADRFGASPSVLSSFVVLQIIVYTSTQIPAGVLLDRIGTKSMLTAGLAIMSVGQLVMGLTHSLPVAIAAYAVVGLGDAFMFVSVIRLIPNWFPPRQAPLVTQLTGICGQLGQVLSAVPFLALLLRNGWTVAYAAAAGLGVLSMTLTLALVSDAPERVRAVNTESTSLRTTLTNIRGVWSRPGTRLGFFTHMGTQFSITVFGLMWGFPYLTKAQGLSRPVAGGLLTVSVATFIIAGVLVGFFSGRYPERRPALVLGMIATIAAMWTLVLALPFRSPAWLLVVLIVVSSVGQPVSIVAFDFARAANPHAILGTAQGMVNTGGHLASLLVMQAMGVILGAAGGYSFNAFRLAWTAQYVIWAVAAAGVVFTCRKARFAEGNGTEHALIHEVAEPGPR